MNKEKVRKPNLFIVGFPRCGTTSMFHYLTEHPEIYFPKEKELNYFFSKNQKDMIPQKKYESYFKNKHETYLGDASPSYILSSSAHKEIKKFNPKSKIIIMVRNKKEAIESYYHQEVINASQNKTMKEIARLFNFKDKITKYKKMFKPQNVCVVQLENLKEVPQKEYRKVLDFLDVKNKRFKPNFRIYGARYNVRYKIINKFLHNTFLRKISRRFIPYKIRKNFELIKKINIKKD